MNDPQPEGHMASYLGRRKFLATLGGAAAAWPLAARTQQGERVRRISMVNVIAESDPEASPRVAVFETALRKLGWTERDLRIDYHWGASRLIQSDCRV